MFCCWSPWSHTMMYSLPFSPLIWLALLDHVLLAAVSSSLVVGWLFACFGWILWLLLAAIAASLAAAVASLAAVIVSFDCGLWVVLLADCCSRFLLCLHWILGCFILWLHRCHGHFVPVVVWLPRSFDCCGPVVALAVIWLLRLYHWPSWSLHCCNHLIALAGILLPRSFALAVLSLLLHCRLIAVLSLLLRCRSHLVAADVCSLYCCRGCSVLSLVDCCSRLVLRLFLLAAVLKLRPFVNNKTGLLATVDHWQEETT